MAEVLHKAVIREYIFDGQVTVYRVMGAGRDVTNAWVDNVLADADAASRAGKPYLTLQDMSQSGTSRYGIQRTRELFTKPPADMRLIAGVVVPDSVHGRFMQISAELFVQPRKHYQIRFFTDHDKAYDWLGLFLS